MLHFECPNCKEILHIPDQYIGTKGKCRKCQASIVPERKKPRPAKNGSKKYGDFRTASLLILHGEAIGPSSRKCNIIELGCLKIDLAGNEIDNFWTFCNPNQHLPTKIQSRTGISEDMLAQAPGPFEVTRDWFNWAGPNPIIISDHAHFHAKFLCAPMLREDVEPPSARIIDAVEWAKRLNIGAPEYRIRPLLQHVGAPLNQQHTRSLDVCRALHKLVVRLLEDQTSKLSETEHKSLFGKILQKDNDEHRNKLYSAILAESHCFTKACGEDYYDRQAFEARKQGIPVHQMNAQNGGEEASFVLHMPEWFEEKRHAIKRYRSQPRSAVDMMDDHSGDAQWEFALIEASQSESPEEKRKYLMRAVDLRAGDPRPYEQMTGFFIKEKNYQSAHDICERYFESENWKKPEHATTSLKMLERLQKLEMKLAKHY